MCRTRGNAFTANPNPTDLTVTTLRDIGIPFPATDRLGRANDDVLLSRPALASMQEATDRKVAETPDLHKSGLTNDCAQEYELMYPAIPVHRTRTPPQLRGT